MKSWDCARLDRSFYIYVNNKIHQLDVKIQDLERADEDWLFEIQRNMS